MNEKFDLDAFNEMSMTFKKVIDERLKYNEEFDKLVKSKEHYKEFLTQNCDDEWCCDFNEATFTLEYTEDKQYRIHWNNTNTVLGDTEYFKTKLLSREMIEKLLDEDDCIKDSGNNREKIKATILYCNKPTANGLIYSSEMMKKQVEEFNKRCKEYGCVLGCLGSLDNFEIHLEEVSHTITKLSLSEDGVLTGDIKILDTPNGKIVQDIGIEKFGCDLQGYGEVNENNEVTDYHLVTINLFEKDKCGCIGTGLKVVEDE